MNQQEFERRKTEDWKELDVALSSLERNRDAVDPARVPKLFRRVCHDLALARHRVFGHGMCEHLNGLAIRGYEVIHRKKGVPWEGVVRFFFQTFPQAVRDHWRLFCVSSLFFWVPFFLMMISVKFEIAWVQALLGPEELSQIDLMYGKGDGGLSNWRSRFGSNFEMFSMYIQNNVGIDFKLYAGGVLFGLGTLFFLLYNGLVIGGVAGYVHHAGDPEKLYSFVAGHSSFELLGMIVVGMAGLKIGMALLAPGQLSRTEAAAKAGKDGLPLLLGGAAMTVVAAVVEGFWSAQDFPSQLKYGVGIFFWVMHVGYFVFTGRRSYGA